LAKLRGTRDGFEAAQRASLLADEHDRNLGRVFPSRTGGRSITYTRQEAAAAHDAAARAHATWSGYDSPEAARHRRSAASHRQGAFDEAVSAYRGSGLGAPHAAPHEDDLSRGMMRERGGLPHRDALPDASVHIVPGLGRHFIRRDGPQSTKFNVYHDDDLVAPGLTHSDALRTVYGASDGGTQVMASNTTGSTLTRPRGISVTSPAMRASQEADSASREAPDPRYTAAGSSVVDLHAEAEGAHRSAARLHTVEADLADDPRVQQYHRSMAQMHSQQAGQHQTVREGGGHLAFRGASEADAASKRAHAASRNVDRGDEDDSRAARLHQEAAEAHERSGAPGSSVQADMHHAKAAEHEHRATMLTASPAARLAAAEAAQRAERMPGQRETSLSSSTRREWAVDSPQTPAAGLRAFAGAPAPAAAPVPAVSPYEHAEATSSHARDNDTEEAHRAAAEANRAAAKRSRGSYRQQYMAAAEEHERRAGEHAARPSGGRVALLTPAIESAMADADDAANRARSSDMSARAQSDAAQAHANVAAMLEREGHADLAAQYRRDAEHYQQEASSASAPRPAVAARPDRMALQNAAREAAAHANATNTPEAHQAAAAAAQAAHAAGADHYYRDLAGYHTKQSGAVAGAAEMNRHDRYSAQLATAAMRGVDADREAREAGFDNAAHRRQVEATTARDVGQGAALRAFAGVSEQGGGHDRPPAAYPNAQRGPRGGWYVMHNGMKYYLKKGIHY